MNKKEFTQMLRETLKGLPKEELEDVLSDYEEHFRIGMEDGRSEEELAAALGNPEKIAKQIKASYLVRMAESTISTGDVLKAVLASVSLGLFNFMVILWPFLIAVSILFSMFVVAASVVMTGIWTLFTSILSPLPQSLQGEMVLIYGIGLHPVASIFISIGIIAFGLLFLIADWYLLKAFYNLTIKYLKMNIDIIGIKGVS